MMKLLLSLASRTVTPLVYALVVVAWELGVRFFHIPTWLLPAPTAIAAATVKWAPELLANTLVTTRETVFGFALALAISIPLSCLIAFNPWARRIIYPAILSLQSVPKVALAPLVTLWLGFTEWPKIIIVILVCFFPILINLIAGLESVPKSMMNLMRSLNSSRHIILWRLQAPAALPAFFTGCKVAITFAVIGAVIAEFVASQEGLGYLILMSTSQSQTPLAFAAIIALTILSIVLFYTVEFIERRCLTWSY
jgi:NitT/TauT family transport system permease protein